MKKPKGPEISKTINSVPIALELEFNNYLNYQNNDDVLDREELDVKILDISPKFSFAKYGFDINIGFNSSNFSVFNSDILKYDIFTKRTYNFDIFDY